MTPSSPLTDAEINELDAALAQIPEQFDALDAVMLDGYLCGVLLQPDLVLPSQWLPFVFDGQGREGAMPGTLEQAQRLIELIMRRYNELAACIAAREPFDPIVYPYEDEKTGAPITGKDGLLALAPWAAGFSNALAAFPALDEVLLSDPDASDIALGILRHVPLDPDDDSPQAQEIKREKAALDRDAPLASLEEGIEEIVGCVLELADIARPNKPVERATPKVGRNDPCPCGSGRKYKHCHGGPN
jgi:uncharacterized protein